MRVLIACEFSGTVRDAFTKRGCDAWSCDLLPSETPGNHFQENIVGVLRFGPRNWDLMIAHPPCTHLAVSGSRWFKNKQKEQEQALEFVRFLMNANIERICIENPISVISSRIRKPDQIIQPWQFGHTESKATCLWLRGLPLLRPTQNVREEMLALPLKERTRIHYASPGPNRWKERSRTYSGIANAMADQWTL